MAMTVNTRNGHRTAPLPATQLRPPATERDPRVLRTASVLSWAIAAGMTAASAAGLFVHGLYRDGAWAREAFRGGDLVSLVLGVPLLIGALVLARRGSLRAQAVWLGMLAYTTYNYLYYSFGPKFNDVFLLHILLVPASIVALVCALTSLDLRAIASEVRHGRAAAWVGGTLLAIGVLQGGLWIFVLIRYVVTGEVMHDIPVAGQHLVFAIDLAFLVPSLLVAGFLLLRRSVMGFVWGAAMSVMGFVYLLNLTLAGKFQADAGVAGVKAFSPESIGLVAAFLIATVVLLGGRRTEA